MTTFLRDLVLGARQLTRRPGFAAAAIASLALGIGLNTTLFSIVNAVLLRGGPVREPERLVEIYSGLSKDFPQLTTSYPDYQDIVRETTAFTGVAGHAFVRGILTGGTKPSLVTGEAISPNYFDVLGVPLRLGRTFRDDENRVPAAVPVAILGHGLWQREFGGRADVLGTSVKLSGVTYEVVGVGPASFSGAIPGVPSEFWVPAMMVERLEFAGVQATADNDPGTTRLDRRGTRWLFLKGRLADGRSVQDARAELDALYARLRTAYPVTNKDVTASAVPAADVRFHPALDGYVRAAGVVLLVAVGLVLLVACANVANLLFARGAARAREFAIRASLGASRSRLVRQLVTEGLVLSAAGGVAGLAIAWWSGRALSGVGSDVFPIPVSFEFSVDRTVLMFAMAASAATALLCSLMPAWSASKTSLVPALKDLPEGSRRRRVSSSQVLVVGQLALSLVLVVAGLLLARGLMSAQRTDIGFDPAPIASLRFNLQMNGYDDSRAVAFHARAHEALRAVPGVVNVSTASRLPLAPDINADEIFVRGVHDPNASGAVTDVVAIGAEYFDTVGVPLVAGRAFTEAEVATGRRVAVVNETFARLYWPNRPAVGQSFYSGGFTSEPTEIIGVARDHKVRSVGEAPRPYVHVPYRPGRLIGFVVRMATPAAATLPQLRQALWSVEPDILFTEDTTAEAVADTTVAPTRIGAWLVGAFGALALGLAAVGLYGVIAYSVGRRTREIGIRMALGASRADVTRMVVGEGARLALVGVALGLVGAAFASRVLESLLYGVGQLDPLAFAGAAAVLLGAALAANLVPALAAARVDPASAIRQ